MKSKVCLTVEAKFNDLNFPENVLINFAKFTKNTCARVSYLIKLLAEACSFATASDFIKINTFYFRGYNLH